MKNENQLEMNAQSDRHHESCQKNQKSSVYSEYDNNQNSSITSRQLQYWLKQIKSHGSSSVQDLGKAIKKIEQEQLPQFGTTIKPNVSANLDHNFENDWTFMTQKSINQASQISFAGRANTFESSYKDIQKENVSLNSNRSISSNHPKQTQRRQQNTSTKSYVNAMIALQKRAKTLEDENSMMKLSLSQMRDMRIKSMSDSQLVEEQLRMRLQELQPKAIKMEELMRENRKIREAKDQKSQRVKALEKALKEAQEKCSKEGTQRQALEQQFYSVQQKLKSQIQKRQKLQEKYSQVKDRNRILEEMKQKSTAKILQKYNKSVQQNEEDERQIQKLSNQLASLKKKYDERVKSLEEKYNRQAQQMRVQNEKLQFENLKLDQKLGEYRFQIKQLKQNFSRNHEEMLNILKTQERERKELKIQQFSSQHSQVKPAQVSKDSSQFLHLQLPVSTYKNQSSQSEQFTRIKEVQTQSFNNQVNINQLQHQNRQVNMKKRQPKEFFYSQVNNGGSIQDAQNHIHQKSENPHYTQQQQSQESESERQRQNFHFSLNKSKKVQTRSLGKQIQKKSEMSNSQQKKPKAVENKSENMSVKKPIQVIIKGTHSKAKSSQKNQKNKKSKKEAIFSNIPIENKENQANLHNLSPGEHQKLRPYVKIPKHPKSQKNYSSSINNNTKNPQSFTLPFTQKHQVRDDSHIFKSCEPIQIRQQIPYGQTLAQQEYEYQHENPMVYLNKMMLIQSEKQTIRLYEEQQKLLNVSTDRLSQSQRAEYLGRMKQIHEQIKVATEKMFELKSR